MTPLPLRRVATAFLFSLIALPAAAQDGASPKLSFFVTSSTHSGNLGGLQGADTICQALATQVGAGHRIWRAYLSTHGTRETQAINARERIGTGPWFNAKGILIAETVADLHGDIQRDSNRIMQGTALTEASETVPGRHRPENTSNQHDILTGSDSHGRAFVAGAMRFNNLTCDNWTNGDNSGQAMVGHHDRLSSWNTSWNSSHASKGCSLVALSQTGGAGRFYCFASD